MYAYFYYQYLFNVFHYPVNKAPFLRARLFMTSKGGVVPVLSTHPTTIGQFRPCDTWRPIAAERSGGRGNG